ncbi:hypothetical protein ACUNV4_12330 [Granulosicoccus sp. 3-233]|uniref:hypothetical protein n=1 Tax=Granulosicoccus sp. 3-233 TaxID=3417969 RepID=UPI003D330A15
MHSTHLSRWKANHSLVTIIGIILNVSVALPLLIWPDFVLAVLHIPPTDSLVMTRFAGGLLIILSVFYTPMVYDIDRYRILAWFQIIPSRTFGTFFFLGAVVIKGAPAGFLVATLIDGTIAILALLCLIRIASLEQKIMNGQADS